MTTFRRRAGMFITVALVVSSCSPTAPTTYIEETYSMVMVPEQSTQDRTFDLGVPQNDGGLTLTLVSWYGTDNDFFTVLLRDATTGASLLANKNCTDWADTPSVHCNSLTKDLPLTLHTNVRRGQKLQLVLHHDRCCMGFNIHVVRPQ